MIQAECFNSYHIQTTIESEVGLLLQNNMTQEEIKEQFRRNKEITDKMFAEDAPRVKEQISKLSPPLDLNKTKKICAALFRKQITEDDIPQELYPELIQTRNYIHISKRIKSFQDNKTE
ncbi:MAG: hypothetical protein MUE53_05820 [Chitinophagales bacterium]|nr:hypothetical protein [Chitinophagales bacterium]